LGYAPREACRLAATGLQAFSFGLSRNSGGYETLRDLPLRLFQISKRLELSGPFGMRACICRNSSVTAGDASRRSRLSRFQASRTIQRVRRFR
jgi:hypothetical protein